MRILIVGCGYIGLPLGRSLAGSGHEVHGVRRNPFHSEGLTAHALDITQQGALDALPKKFDWVINTVSSSGGGVEAHRAVFVEGTKNLLEWLDGSSARPLFTSSTGVYGQLDGSWVDEQSTTDPKGTGSNLLQAEKKLRESSQSATVLRVAGIYGPDRGYLYRQFLKGKAVLSDGGNRWINMIHRDDLISAILTAMEAEPGIYNVADDKPVKQRSFFQWLSSQLGKPLPPEGKSTMGKRALTNKRVRNEKLKATGWTPRFPTFREGYEAIIREE